MWGVTVTGTVLQNIVSKRLPAEFLAQFPQGSSVAYAMVPLVRTLPEPLKSQVQDAYLTGIRGCWYVVLGAAVLGFASSWFMKALPLHTAVDRDWGLEEGAKDSPATDSSGASTPSHEKDMSLA